MMLKEIKLECDSFIEKIKDEVRSFYVDDNFLQIANSLAKANGKIIFTGIGKSGIIGKKISATMASLGKPSFFIHLSEMIHGDIGMISSDDCLIIISVSGKADEFKYIIQHCKAENIKLFSITRNRKSLLAKNSTPIFIKYKSDLLDAYGIYAPMISGLLTTIIGDLLVACITRINNFSCSDYVKLHPGGKIGSLAKKFINKKK